MRKHKATKNKPLAVLTEDERVEYALRYNLLLQKRMEINALAQVQDAFQDVIMDKYGLPTKFDITLQTGEIYPRGPEGGNDAQNGRV